MNKVNMQTCLEVISDCISNPYDAKIEFGTMYFFVSDEDFAHILEWQEYIRTLLSPKYQILMYDFGIKSVVVTLTRNLI